MQSLTGGPTRESPGNTCSRRGRDALHLEHTNADRYHRGERRVVTVQFRCPVCPFVYEVDGNLRAVGGISRAPVHPVHRESGDVTWRMCTGSAKQGVAVS
jgi:hypothetical protein